MTQVHGDGTFVAGTRSGELRRARAIDDASLVDVDMYRMVRVS